MEFLIGIVLLLPLASIFALLVYWNMKDSAIGDTTEPQKIDACDEEECRCKDKHCGEECCCNKDGCGDCGCGNHHDNAKDQED